MEQISLCTFSGFGNSVCFTLGDILPFPWLNVLSLILHGNPWPSFNTQLKQTSSLLWFLLQLPSPSSTLPGYILWSITAVMRSSDFSQVSLFHWMMGSHAGRDVYSNLHTCTCPFTEQYFIGPLLCTRACAGCWSSNYIKIWSYLYYLEYLENYFT